MIRGIMTLAVGSHSYVEMAKDLALSAWKHCPTTTRAVVTDSRDAELARLFDIVLPVDHSLGDPFFQKLWLDKYSPFDEMLFIDSDSLVVGNLDLVWQACEGHSCGFVGEKMTIGSWCGADVAAVCRAYRLPWLVGLNSGMLFLRSGHAVSQLFATARDAMGDYESLGFERFRGTRADEVGFALAFSQRGIEPIDDPQGLTMRTPIGIDGDMQIDVLRGCCRFVKEGQRVAPTIVHFATWHHHPLYHRERAKLRFYYLSPLTRPFARLGGAWAYRKANARTPGLC